MHNLLDFNIYNPSSFNHQFFNTNGHKYHFVEQGDRTGPLVVFIHGFPELWYSWRHQIEYFSNLGFHVVALDKPGYGGTVVGKDLKNFTIKSTCEDVKELVLKKLNRDKAIFIGHDWGAQVVWMMCLYYPQMVEAVVGLSLPFFPPQKEYRTLRQAAINYPSLSYQVALSEGSIEEFNENISEFLESFWITKYDSEKSILETPFGTSILEQYRKTKLAKNDLPDKEFLEYLCSQYKIQGLEGPTNWYRTSFLNFQDASIFPPEIKIQHKALNILGLGDFLTDFAENSFPHFTQLTYKFIEGGHWINIINHEKVNTIIYQWLRSFMNPTRLNS